MGFHFNINRDEFLRAIGTMQNITGKKGTMAILVNVLMEVTQEGLILTATDLEIGLKNSSPPKSLKQECLLCPRKSFLNWFANHRPR